MINKRRCEILVQTVQSRMGEGVKIYGSDAGLHILLKVNNNENQQRRTGGAHRIEVIPEYF